jgi:hypothetical protein
MTQDSAEHLRHAQALQSFVTDLHLSKVLECNCGGRCDGTCFAAVLDRLVMKGPTGAIPTISGPVLDVSLTVRGS